MTTGKVTAQQLTALSKRKSSVDGMQQKKAGLNTFHKMLKGGAGSRLQDKKLREACIDMESILLKQMLTVMRKTVKKSGLTDGGHAEEIFTDMLYEQYAKKMAQNQSFGLAETMYSQLSHGRSWDGKK